MRDAANVMMRVCDCLRQQADRYGVDDPRAANRDRELGRWNRPDFDDDNTATFTFDVTDAIDGHAGTYFATIAYDHGDYSTSMTEATIISAQGEVLAEACDPPVCVGRYEQWHEMRIDVAPEIMLPQLRLRVVLRVNVLDTVARDSWESSGQVGIRRGWDEKLTYATIRNGKA